MGHRRRRATRETDAAKLKMEWILYQVARRDMWMCWVCGDTVDRALHNTTHPMRPTKDHLIPQIKGGSSGMWNLRLAHWRCNELRPDNVPPPRAELIKHTSMKSYPILLERFQSAYGYPFASHEDEEACTREDGFTRF